MASLLRGSHEVRAALIHPDANLGPAQLLEISGWPISTNHQTLATAEAAGSKPRAEVSAGVTPQAGALVSSVEGCLGHWTGAVRRAEQVAAVGNHTAVPLLRAPAVAGGVYVAVVTLAGAGSEPVPRVRLDGFELAVSWSDGSRETLSLNVF